MCKCNIFIQICHTPNSGIVWLNTNGVLSQQDYTFYMLLNVADYITIY